MAEIYVITVSPSSTLLLAGTLGANYGMFLSCYGTETHEILRLFLRPLFSATGLGCVAPYFFVI